MAGDITVRGLGEAEFAAWNRVVAEAPEGSIYADTEYLEIFCRAAGGRFRVLAAEKGGEFLGGLALYERSTRWGVTVGPRLLLQYNGFVLRASRSKYPSETTAARVQTLASLAGALAPLRHANLVVKCRSPLADLRALVSAGWTVSPAYTYVVPLTDLPSQWALVEQNLRRLYKRAEREGLHFTDDDDFDSLFRLHADTHRRKGAPIYLPERAFRTYFEAVRAKGLAKLFHARLPDGRAIATQLVLLGPHRTSHTVCASADPERQGLGANPFLRWKTFEVLAALGYEANDLTDASLNPVTHFKSQLGGRLELTLVAAAPASRTWRLGTAAERAVRRLLAAVGVERE